LNWMRWALVATVSMSILPVGVARSEQYPSRTISIVTPVAPGVPFDLLGRLLADRLRQKLGTSAVVENVTGGNGLIATQRVLNSKADGYSFLLASTGITAAPSIMNNAGYSPRDFVAIAPLGQVPYVLLVSAAVPANDVESLMVYIGDHAKSINFGVLMTSGTGSLLSRKLGSIANVELTEVGYRGSTAMITALLANEIQIMATTYSVAGPHLQAGKIKAIGALGDERMKQLPNLPTFKEKGYPSLTTNVWAALFARAGTPPEVLSKARGVSREIVADPSYLKAMEATGMEPWSIPFDSLQAYVDEDAKTFKLDADKFKLKPE
jgi:tripartite-type tricarboxylate transporter receptor subunit TctC